MNGMSYYPRIPISSPASANPLGDSKGASLGALQGLSTGKKIRFWVWWRLPIRFDRDFQK